MQSVKEKKKKRLPDYEILENIKSIHNPELQKLKQAKKYLEKLKERRS